VKKDSTGRYIIAEGRLLLPRQVEEDRRTTYSAFIDWEVTSKSEDGTHPVFSAQGTIRWADGGYQGGQCLDEIARLYPAHRQAQAVVTVWRRWHLNDMKAGCEHQRAGHWGEETLTLVTYRLRPEVLRQQHALQHTKLHALKAAKVVGLTDAEQRLLRLPWEVVRSGDPEEKDTAYGEHPGEEYEVHKTEQKTAGWVYGREHPRGKLSARCPVCGYCYGTAWMQEELPADVLAEILSWAPPRP
jgi:hypothetical protein